MTLDLCALHQSLQDAKAEELVSSENINPYLLNEVLKPMLSGIPLRYGDIDYSRFEADDLRTLADHYDQKYSVANQLEKLVGVIAEAVPSACRNRAFC